MVFLYLRLVVKAFKGILRERGVKKGNIKSITNKSQDCSFKGVQVFSVASNFIILSTQGILSTNIEDFVLYNKIHVNNNVLWLDPKWCIVSFNFA